VGLLSVPVENLNQPLDFLVQFTMQSILSPAANPFQTFLIYSAASVVGAFAIACVSVAVETLTYKAYLFLEREGLVRRLVPDIKSTQTHYKLATFKTFIGSLYFTYMIILYLREPLVAAAKPNWNWWRIYSEVWLITLVHDWWFWFVHFVMHK
jgi:hypothetical protein